MSFILPGGFFADISIPLLFDGPQPNAFGAEPATSRPVEAGELVGDTRRGGSCNFEQYSLIPHCNGTHTECIGHITSERISVTDCLLDALVEAVVISVRPEPAFATRDTYPVRPDPSDLLITEESLSRAVDEIGRPLVELSSDAGPRALIVRTLPNGDDKLRRRYDSDRMPPFFSTEAMRSIVAWSYKHLLVDLPSIDRLSDEGRLSNHRLFWNVKPGSFDREPDSRIDATITELIFVPTSVPDGLYLLNLQIAPFASDAAPSRPLLFETRS